MHRGPPCGPLQRLLTSNGVNDVIQEPYEKLVRMVQEAADDVQKADGGNKAAGTRVRKAMQDIKNVCQEIRQAVLETRDQDKAQNK